VGIFRKKETYNEQMLREAGLDRVVFNTPQPASPEGDPPEAPPPYDLDDIHLGPIAGRVKSGQLDWDCVVSVRDPAIPGDHVDFTVLPSGDLIIVEEKGDGDLTPLADAIEEKIDPPYRASASRHGVDLWAVGAKQIEVAEIPFPVADALELSVNDGETEFRADGDVSQAAVPAELRRLGEPVGSNFCVEASRIDGDYWEVKVSPL